MSNTELAGRQVDLGEGYVVIATKRPLIDGPDGVDDELGPVDFLGREADSTERDEDNRWGSYAWSHDHLVRFHGVSPDEIERDILEAKLPGDALTGRHWDDHDADNGAALAIPHEHIGDYRADVETLRMERDHLREGLGESRDLETPIGRKLDIVERLLRLLSEDD